MIPGFFAQQARMNSVAAGSVFWWHMDGAHGETSITEDGPLSLPMITVGSAALSTAEVKFGTAALLAGTGGIKADYDPRFILGASDFDMGCWIYKTGHPGVETCLIARWSGIASTAWFMGINPSGHLTFYNICDGDTGLRFPFSSVSVPNTGWSYVRQFRSESAASKNRVYFEINGSPAGDTGELIGTNNADGRKVIRDVSGGVLTSTPLSIAMDGGGTNRLPWPVDDMHLSIGPTMYPGVPSGPFTP